MASLLGEECNLILPPLYTAMTYVKILCTDWDAWGSYTCNSDNANVHFYVTKTRIHLQNSRKLDCPAVMQIRCIRVFNCYFIDKVKFLSDNSLVMAKRAIIKEINDKSKSDSRFSLRTSTRFHVKIPLSSSRRDSSTIGQYVDIRVVDKIYDLVNRNITNLSEVQRSLDKYVREDLFSGHPEERRPKKTNRRYHTCRQDLCNHIAKVISAVKYCDDDQESSVKKIEDWQTKSPKSNLFYRQETLSLTKKMNQDLELLCTSRAMTTTNA